MKLHHSSCSFTAWNLTSLHCFQPLPGGKLARTSVAFNFVVVFHDRYRYVLAQGRMKIYTKTGDAGTSSLYSGARRQKDDVIFHALGDVDELNSAVGVSRDLVADLDQQLAQQLEVIQSRLLDVGSAVATPIEATGPGTAAKQQRVQFDTEGISALETWIDQMDQELPQLTNFILPSGGHGSSSLHMARSICRRAERAVVPLVQQGSVGSNVGIYMNRLSDYLFTAARLAAKRAGKEEVTYRKA